MLNPCCAAFRFTKDTDIPDLRRLPFVDWLVPWHMVELATDVFVIAPLHDHTDIGVANLRF